MSRKPFNELSKRRKRDYVQSILLPQEAGERLEPERLRENNRDQNEDDNNNPPADGARDVFVNNPMHFNQPIDPPANVHVDDHQAPLAPLGDIINGDIQPNDDQNDVFDERNQPVRPNGIDVNNFQGEDDEDNRSNSEESELEDERSNSGQSEQEDNPSNSGASEQENSENEEPGENVENEVPVNNMVQERAGDDHGIVNLEFEPNQGNNDDDEYDERYDEATFAGAPLSIAKSMLLLLSLFLNHNLTQSCLSDIMIVLNLHFIDNDAFHHSLYKLKKFFKLSKLDRPVYLKHRYCSSCFVHLNHGDVCLDCVGPGTTGDSYFIEIPILQQLQKLYARQGFFEKLQNHFRLRHARGNTIKDLYDGALYQRLVENGFLSNPNNISLTWYTDGIPVFKSSKVSMWPIYLTINELPSKERTKRANLLLAGLWFGTSKPNANTFLQKLQPEFDHLRPGEVFNLPDGRRINVQGVILFGTCDLPAKAEFLNLTQFNGMYGCPTCVFPGERLHLETGGTTQVYRYVENPQMRTTTSTMRYADIALDTNNPVMGVKGPSILSNLMPDYIMGTAIDRMHGIDGGPVKKMLSLWFDSAYANWDFSLAHVIDVINERLVSIKPPKFIHRMPRSIEDLLHWKASELKARFLYYSLPVLSGVMPDKYFQHYTLLVAGISILNSDEISEVMLNIANNLLNKFVRESENLYDLQFCSINIHQILHLPQCVKNLGPLWAYSCYQYEDLNGQFLNLIHGTWHIESQIAVAHIQLLRMQRHIETLEDGYVRDFCAGERHGVKICERISRSCYSVGTYKLFSERRQQHIVQALRHIIREGTTKMYLRLLKNSKLYLSEQYSQNLQTVSSYVVYEENGFFRLGLVHCFIKKCEVLNCVRNQCACESAHYAVIQKFHPVNVFTAVGDNDVSIPVPHLSVCNRENNFTVISVDSLKEVCVFMNIDNLLYL